MKKIINPHLENDPEQYQCIGCSPHNSIGLKLEFWDNGEEVISEWEPRSELMGWVNVLHGGIQATLLDEIGGWIVYVKCESAGVTTDLNVNYKKAIYTNQGKITLKGRLIRQEKRTAIIEAELYNSKGEMCTSAEIKYFVFPEKIAREKYHYPGIKAFYE